MVSPQLLNLRFFLLLIALLMGSCAIMPTKESRFNTSVMASLKAEREEESYLQANAHLITGDSEWMWVREAAIRIYSKVVDMMQAMDEMNLSRAKERALLAAQVKSYGPHECFDQLNHLTKLYTQKELEAIKHESGKPASGFLVKFRRSSKMQ